MAKTSETRVVYEVAAYGGGAVMCEADVEVRAKTAKVLDRRRGAKFARGDSSISGYGSTVRLDQCDWTKADAVARFVASYEAEIAQLREKVAAAEEMIASAKALPVEAP